MHKLIGYIKQQANTNFHGGVRISFQHGKIGDIKVSNSLPVEHPFEVWAIDEVLKRMTKWKKSGFYGIIEIPFQHGTVGKPKECRVLKLHEL